MPPPILPVKIPWITPAGGQRGRFFLRPPGNPATAPAAPMGFSLTGLTHPRAYFDTTIAADGTITYALVGYGQVTGPGTLYPIDPMSRDQALAYYWRRYSGQQGMAYTVNNTDGTTHAYSGTLPRVGYGIKNGFRTFGFPASTDTRKSPMLFERASGLNLKVNPLTVQSQMCGIFSPADTTKVFMTDSAVVTSTGIKSIKCPCGGNTADIIGVGPPPALTPIHYSVPSYNNPFLIFPNGAPIYFDPAALGGAGGYYLPCTFDNPPNGSEFANDFPPSVNPQELTTKVTDYTTLDFNGDPLVTTTYAWTTSVATWTLDGMSGAFFDPGPVKYSYGTDPDDSETVAYLTYSGSMTLQTFDAPLS